jgi:hypothetical protein
MSSPFHAAATLGDLSGAQDPSTQIALGAKLTQNVRINIKNIHVRVEDVVSNPKVCSLGGLLHGLLQGARWSLLMLITMHALHCTAVQRPMAYGITLGGLSVEATSDTFKLPVPNEADFIHKVLRR